MALSYFFKTILPVLVAIFLSPLPKKLGFYEFLFSLNTPTVGLLPCSLSGTDRWGFTLEDLYGDGGDDSWNERRKKSYRNRLRNQKALVTGANSGIGYEISLALARLGVDVTLACRDAKKCRSAADAIAEDPTVTKRAKADRDGAMPELSTARLDLSELESVRTFASDFLETGTTLDMVFFNAGVLSVAPNDDGSNRLSEDGIELVFATNVVGHHLLYKLLIERRQQNRQQRNNPLRIVATSSMMSYLTKHPYKVPTDLETLNGVKDLSLSLYSQSKLAQILWVQELTARLDASAAATEDPNEVVYANAAHPGVVNTNIAADVSSLGRVAKFRHDLLTKHAWSADEGALTLLYLGTAADDLRRRTIRGQYFHPQSIRIEDHRDASVFDPNTKILREKLWTFLDELVSDFV